MQIDNERLLCDMHVRDMYARNDTHVICVCVNDSYVRYIFIIFKALFIKQLNMNRLLFCRVSEMPYAEFHSNQQSLYGMHSQDQLT